MLTYSHRLVLKLRSQKIMLKRPVARSQASGATAPAAQAIDGNNDPAQQTRSAPALPSQVADADGDLEMTGAGAGEGASLTADSLRRIIHALAQIAPGARLQLQLCEAGNATANGRRPPRAVDVQVPNGAGPVPVTTEVARRIASVVHQIAPGFRVKLSQPPTDLQSATQPPPPPYTAADQARARLMARRGWVRT